MKTYRITPHTARSISIDSTFERTNSCTFETQKSDETFPLSGKLLKFQKNESERVAGAGRLPARL
jgi:hypothetical protein